MADLHKIIEQIQKELFCPVCGKHYELGKLLIKGFYNKTLIIQTECASRHLTIFMTSVNSNSEKQTISSDDVITLHQELKSFDGNFIKLFKQN